jgi:hypothetical protein
MLITYAIVSREMIGCEDIISGLLPFFEPLLVKYNGQLFDKGAFMNDVLNSLTWAITSDIADQIIGRMIKKGWLTRELPANDQVYHVSLPDSSKVIEETNVSRLEEVSDAFDYFLDTLPKRPSNLSTGQARTEMLLEWLVASFSQPQNTDDNSDGEHKGRPKSELRHQAESHLCARFALWLSRMNPSLAQYLAEIGGAVILTEVIFHFRKPTFKRRSVSQLVVLVDAPLLMDYLGLSGPVLKESAAHIIDKFREVGATIGCFGHSRDEIFSILTALLASDEAGRYGPTAEALRRGDITLAEVRSVFAGLDSRIKKAGVQKITNTPGQMTSVATYFPDELVDEVERRLGQSNLPARERDARSVAVVMRKRQGHRSGDLFDCRAVLLSQSRTLVVIANSVCIANDLLGAHDIGPVIHRSQAAGALFLVMGLGEREKVSRSQLLGTCMDIVKLRPRIVSDLKAQLGKATAGLSEEELDSLLTDPRCATALMDSTVGAGKIIDRHNVEEIVQNIKLSLLDTEAQRHADQLKELKRRMKEEQIRRQREFESRLANLEREWELDRERLLTSEANRADMRRILKTTLDEFVQDGQNLIRRYRVLGRVGLAVLVCLIAAAALWISRLFGGGQWELIYQAAVIVLTLGVEIGAILGFDLMKLIDRWFTERVQRTFEQQIVRHKLEEVRKYYDVDLCAGTLTPISP